MARTKASVGAKVASGKSSKARCSVAPPPRNSIASGSTERSSRSTGGGNPVCSRETPQWQKRITNFFICKDVNRDKKECREKDDEIVAGNSKQKRNIIESDSEEEEVEKPKNKVLDETIELEPLNGDDSHKIEEFYAKNGVKGKGVGKRSKGKENRVSEKREREEDIEMQVSKKVKVCDD